MAVALRGSGVSGWSARPVSTMTHPGGAQVWHYKDADPDLGAWQAKELLDHLEGVLSNEPVEVISGQSIVEVKPQARAWHPTVLLA